ncbi:MAG: phage baseplate assembly protein V [Methylocystis sp.]|uniref:phage baseplate assembly protein V n=1 Tax=Methylocystis sp. TaxID=1911079 RepID=UPI003DA59AC9
MNAPLRPLAYYGLYPALVVDIVDQDGLGRVKVRFPSLDAGDAYTWARLLSCYAEDDQGWQIMPSVGTEVIVGFEAGDPSRAYIVGAAWNGREKPPETPRAANDKRVLVTRAGSRLEFDDNADATKATLSLRSGHTVELDDATQRVTVRSAGGCSVVLDAAGVTVTANASVTINAASVDINAPTVNCSGQVNCASISTGSITSGVYSPGAGNIW